MQDQLWENPVSCKKPRFRETAFESKGMLRRYVSHAELVSEFPELYGEINSLSYCRLTWLYVFIVIDIDC